MSLQISELVLTTTKSNNIMLLLFDNRAAIFHI